MSALVDVLPSATQTASAPGISFLSPLSGLACTRLLDHLDGECVQIRADEHRQSNVTFTAYISPGFQLLSKAASVGP
jgi:hypothetical protein